MKTTTYRIVAIAALMLASIAGVSAQRNGIHEKITRLGFEFEVNAGTSLGGATPLPLPAEIRHIDSYSPDLDLQLGLLVTKWLDNERKWGVAVGARLETRGMKTRATV